MNVVISDYLFAECEISGREGDCVRAKLDSATPDAVISTSELIKWLRFTKKQEDKKDKKSNVKAQGGEQKLG